MKMTTKIPPEITTPDSIAHAAAGAKAISWQLLLAATNITQ
jgi:hypothetical protein